MPVTRSAPLSSSAAAPRLTVHVEQDGTVSGTAAPGARIEIANLSTAPTGHRLPHDVVEVVTADAQGRFSLRVASAVNGDVLQVQARDDAGAAPSSTVQLRVDAQDRAADPRAAFISLKRLRVELEGAADGADGVAVVSARTSLPLSEPDAVVRFTNTRTGKSVDAIVDPLGRIAPARIEARLGDTVDVAVSDDIASRAPVSCGALTVERAAASTPAAQDKDAPYTRLVTIPGRLFLDELAGKIGLGKQGSIGNCPVPAGASAIAAIDDGAIRDLIRPRGDGTFVVTFHPAGAAPREIVVDDRLYARGTSPVYGNGAQVGGEVELWFPLVEKAYAELVGGYEVLGKGTSVGKVMADLTGRENSEVWLAGADVDDVWKRMQRARAHKQAMACGTYPSSEGARYRGTGLYPNHAYSVLNLEETSGGKRLVTMRNPWGGAAGYSGEFQIAIEDFLALYQVLNIC